MESIFIAIVLWSIPLTAGIDFRRTPSGKTKFMTTHMKAYLSGSLGVIFTFVLYTQISASYANYTDRIETSEILTSLAPLQCAIEEDILNKQNKSSVQENVKQAEAFPRIRQVKVFEGGIIFAQGRKAGQAILLSPSVNNGEIIWNCAGGPDKAMPLGCRTLDKNNFPAQKPCGNH